MSKTHWIRFIALGSIVALPLAAQTAAVAQPYDQNQPNVQHTYSPQDRDHGRYDRDRTNKAGNENNGWGDRDRNRSDRDRDKSDRDDHKGDANSHDRDYDNDSH